MASRASRGRAGARSASKAMRAVIAAAVAAASRGSTRTRSKQETRLLTAPGPSKPRNPPVFAHRSARGLEPALDARRPIERTEPIEPIEPTVPRPDEGQRDDGGGEPGEERPRADPVE